MLLLDDAVVLAGATGRVGGATLREFTALGAFVFVLSRTKDRAAQAIEDHVEPQHRERAVPYAADLNDPEAAAAAVEAAVKQFGRVDAAVTLSGRGHFVPLRSSTLRDLQENLQGNLLDNYNLLVPALRAMLERAMPEGELSRGRLVAVSAGSSKDPQPRFGLFGASKAALNVLMQAIAREHKADGIVANSVVLGSVATDAAKFLHFLRAVLRPASTARSST
jgi:NAD(P)-dependent dehydrogenase (short-subunit alcohol dehydrogenase family)